MVVSSGEKFIGVILTDGGQPSVDTRGHERIVVVVQDESAGLLGGQPQQILLKRTHRHLLPISGARVVNEEEELRTTELSPKSWKSSGDGGKKPSVSIVAQDQGRHGLPAHPVRQASPLKLQIHLESVQVPLSTDPLAVELLLLGRIGVDRLFFPKGRTLQEMEGLACLSDDPAGHGNLSGGVP
jgi:hypothetical protein